MIYPKISGFRFENADKKSVRKRRILVFKGVFIEKKYANLIINMYVDRSGDVLKHPIDIQTVTERAVVDEDVCDGADQFAALNDGATAHSL